MNRLSAFPHQAAALSAENGAAAEDAGCPPPLRWQQVLQAVQRDARGWECRREGAVLTGCRFGRGPALYVLPNVWGDRKLFSLLMWLLRDAMCTVLLDWPQPAGNKPLPAERLSAEQLAADLLTAARQQGDEQFSVFATSFGGLAALCAAAAQPDRIQRLVCHAGFASLRLSLTERLLLRAGSWSRRTLGELPFFERLQTYNHRGWFPPFDHSRWDFLLENLGQTPVRELSRRLRALRRCDVRSKLRAVKTPVLLLTSESAGPRQRQRSAELAAALPRVSTEDLPHCGHFPYLTHPHLLTRELRKFLMSP